MHISSNLCLFLRAIIFPLFFLRLSFSCLAIFFLLASEIKASVVKYVKLYKIELAPLLFSFSVFTFLFLYTNEKQNKNYVASLFNTWYIYYMLLIHCICTLDLAMFMLYTFLYNRTFSTCMNVQKVILCLIRTYNFFLKFKCVIRSGQRKMT